MARGRVWTLSSYVDEAGVQGLDEGGVVVDVDDGELHARRGGLAAHGDREDVAPHYRSLIVLPENVNVDLSHRSWYAYLIEAETVELTPNTTAYNFTNTFMVY